MAPKKEGVFCVARGIPLRGSNIQRLVTRFMPFQNVRCGRGCPQPVLWSRGPIYIVVCSRGARRPVGVFLLGTPDREDSWSLFFSFWIGPVCGPGSWQLFSTFVSVPMMFVFQRPGCRSLGIRRLRAGCGC